MRHLPLLLLALHLLALLAGCKKGGSGDGGGPPGLGAARGFAVLAATGIASRRPLEIEGAVGVSPGDLFIGFPPAVLRGEAHLGDAAAARAQADLEAALQDIDGRRVDVALPDGELGGKVFTPGVYRVPSAAAVSRGDVVLDAGGDPEAFFVFQVPGALITSRRPQVVLLNGATPSRVFWRVGGAVNIGAGTSFKGVFMSEGSITNAAEISLEGSALSHRGSVTFQARESMVVDGLRRRFLLYLPLSHPSSTAMPLVIVLHGGFATSENAVLLTLGCFDALAEEEGFLVAYPEGIDRRWNDGRDLEEQADVDDVAFISQLIDLLISEFNADRRRVYVTGISSGAIMAYRLACELSGKIAAVAPVIGSMAEGTAVACSPSRPVPLLAINGLADPQVRWEGGTIRFLGQQLGRVVGVEESVEFWARRAGCSTVPAVVTEPDLDPADGTRVHRASYPGCGGGGEVLLYAVEGGGHTWPRGWQYLSEDLVGRTSRDLDACGVIWRFFQGHSLP